MKCPRCGNGIPESRIVKGVIYCACGWEPEATRANTQNRLLKFLSIGGLIAIFITGITYRYFYSQWREFTNEAVPILVKLKLSKPTDIELHRLGAICNTFHKTDCSIQVYEKLAESNPTDSISVANLAMALTKDNQHEKAVSSFEKVFAMGVGSSDTYFWYSKSLFKLNRTDEAITAGYKVIEINPRLVDAVENLTEYLIAGNRPEEALSLLNGKINEFPQTSAYFKGKVIAIEDILKKRPIQNSNNTAIRFPALQSHYFIPIRFDSNRFYAFLYDTGATSLTLNTKIVEESGLEKLFKGKTKIAVTANGEKVFLKSIMIPSLWVGSFELRNIEANYCDDCALLMGQNLNSQFESTIQKINGTEFLTLKLSKP